MQVELVDQYTDVTIEFRDTIFDHKLHLTGNKNAPFHLNKEALKNITYANCTLETDKECDIRTYSNLGWQEDLGINICFLIQEVNIPFLSFKKCLEKIMLN